MGTWGSCGPPPLCPAGGPCLWGGRMSSDGRGALHAVGGRQGRQGLAGAGVWGCPALCSAAASPSRDTEVKRVGFRTNPGEAGVSPSGLGLMLPVSPGARKALSLLALGPQRGPGEPAGRRGRQAAASAPRGRRPHPAAPGAHTAPAAVWAEWSWLAVLTPRACGRMSSPG